MGSIKYRNSMDLTKAEDIKKKCQEYTGKPYPPPKKKKQKKHFMTQITTMVQEQAAKIGSSIKTHTWSVLSP